MKTKHSPYNHQLFVGYVTQVFPQFAKVHFPNPNLLQSYLYAGDKYDSGSIGSYLIIESENHGFLCRLIDVSITDSDRKKVTDKTLDDEEFYPNGRLEILLIFKNSNPLEAHRTFKHYPKIGNKVYSCNSEFVEEFVSNFGSKKIGDEVPKVNLGTILSYENCKVTVTQQSLLGRHLAIVGTTGGGKSYTVSKVIENLLRNKTKTILIDATGEFENHSKHPYVTSIDLGGADSYFHYSNLSIDDLFILLKPSGRVQAPKLLEAIRSLKMARINNYENITVDDKILYVQNDLVIKTNSHKRAYETFYYLNTREIENGKCDFNIKNLAKQISQECIWTNGGTPRQPDTTIYGNRNETDISNCITLISRINNIISTPEYSNIFGFDEELDDTKDITKIIDSFYNSDDKHLLRLDFSNVPFDFQAREILANSIGRYLLMRARRREFIEKPMVLILDEAHQFLNKQIADPFFETKKLDSYDHIAKECRKYGLFLCICTQVPRDIPLGTLNQVGSIISHRLINIRDKEAIISASPQGGNLSEFLPTLGAGEALLLGVDYPMPLFIKIDMPSILPDSGTPNF